MTILGTLALDLLLLGFQPIALGTPIVAGTAVFDKPNAKLLEDVLHFLLLTTKPTECSERLLYCYPATNSLQSKQFRAEALKLYEELRKNGEISRDIVLRKSMFEEGVGERLEEGLERWAQFLLTKRGILGTPAPVSLTGAAYAMEMLFPGSAHHQLAHLQEQVGKAKAILTRI